MPHLNPNSEADMARAARRRSPEELAQINQDFVEATQQQPAKPPQRPRQALAGIDSEAIYQRRRPAQQQPQQATTRARGLPDPAEVYERRQQQAAANHHREG